MWYCWCIRKIDEFKHLSMVTDNLDEIFDFIKQLTNIDPDDFRFEIERK
jgi:hypothetical protein